MYFQQNIKDTIFQSQSSKHPSSFYSFSDKRTNYSSHSKKSKKQSHPIPSTNSLFSPCTAPWDWCAIAERCNAASSTNDLWTHKFRRITHRHLPQTIQKYNHRLPNYGPWPFWQKLYNRPRFVLLRELLMLLMTTTCPLPNRRWSKRILRINRTIDFLHRCWHDAIKIKRSPYPTWIAIDRLFIRYSLVKGYNSRNSPFAGMNLWIEWIRRSRFSNNAARELPFPPCVLFSHSHMVLTACPIEFSI